MLSGPDEWNRRRLQILFVVAVAVTSAEDVGRRGAPGCVLPDGTYPELCPYAAALHCAGQVAAQYWFVAQQIVPQGGSFSPHDGVAAGTTVGAEEAPPM